MCYFEEQGYFGANRWGVGEWLKVWIMSSRGRLVGR